MDEKQILDSMQNNDFKDVPFVSLKSIHIKNFKAYDDWTMDFSDGDKCKPFICFMGDNGTGKSTVLNAIQLLFSNFEGYSKTRLRHMLEKCVRHVDKDNYKNPKDVDFLLEAEIVSSDGNYNISMNKNGFIVDHPSSIKSFVYRLCYYSRFDQELNQFQLIREQWDKFKLLFESVTGFAISENIDLFSASESKAQSEMMEKYILGFTVEKPYETISHKECSNGEKKIIKSFSTMLNLEVSPRIMLIDDIAMHVSLDRHIPLIEAMKICYPYSQVFSTAHSYRMSKSIKRHSQIYDLRKIHADKIMTDQPWRLYFLDEINDALYKLDGIDGIVDQSVENVMGEGKKIKDACYRDIKDLQKFREDVSKFLKEVSDLYTIGMLSCDRNLAVKSVNN